MAVPGDMEQVVPGWTQPSGGHVTVRFHTVRQLNGVDAELWQHALLTDEMAVAPAEAAVGGVGAAAAMAAVSPGAAGAPASSSAALPPRTPPAATPFRRGESLRAALVMLSQARSSAARATYAATPFPALPAPAPPAPPATVAPGEPEGTGPLPPSLATPLHPPPPAGRSLDEPPPSTPAAPSSSSLPPDNLMARTQELISRLVQSVQTMKRGSTPPRSPQGSGVLATPAPGVGAAMGMGPDEGGESTAPPGTAPAPQPAIKRTVRRVMRAATRGRLMGPESGGGEGILTPAGLGLEDLESLPDAVPPSAAAAAELSAPPPPQQPALLPPPPAGATLLPATPAGPVPTPITTAGKPPTSRTRRIRRQVATVAALSTPTRVGSGPLEAVSTPAELSTITAPVPPEGAPSATDPLSPSPRASRIAFPNSHRTTPGHSTVLVPPLRERNVGLSGVVGLLGVLSLGTPQLSDAHLLLLMPPGRCFIAAKHAELWIDPTTSSAGRSASSLLRTVGVLSLKELLLTNPSPERPRSMFPLPGWVSDPTTPGDLSADTPPVPLDDASLTYSNHVEPLVSHYRPGSQPSVPAPDEDEENEFPVAVTFLVTMLFLLAHGLADVPWLVPFRAFWARVAARGDLSDPAGTRAAFIEFFVSELGTISASAEPQVPSGVAAFIRGEVDPRDVVARLFDALLRESEAAYGRVVANAHHITDRASHLVGAGLYPIVSIFNHSCWPNSMHSCAPGGLMCVRTLGPVPAGTHLTVSYIELCRPTAERRRLLQRRYGFWCRCHRQLMRMDKTRRPRVLLLPPKHSRIRPCQPKGPAPLRPRSLATVGAPLPRINARVTNQQVRTRAVPVSLPTATAVPTSAEILLGVATTSTPTVLLDLPANVGALSAGPPAPDRLLGAFRCPHCAIGGTLLLDEGSGDGTVGCHGCGMTFPREVVATWAEQTDRLRSVLRQANRALSGGDSREALVTFESILARGGHLHAGHWILCEVYWGMCLALQRLAAGTLQRARNDGSGDTDCSDANGEAKELLERALMVGRKAFNTISACCPPCWPEVGSVSWTLALLEAALTEDSDSGNAQGSEAKAAIPLRGDTGIIRAGRLFARALAVFRTCAGPQHPTTLLIESQAIRVCGQDCVDRCDQLAAGIPQRNFDEIAFDGQDLW
ncbi:putative SET and MYND domain-containing protein [Paratrimastix pyriformis]|uniref:SET and MYND domain-containing protein n=1 Tax=Paratrimastix pyriformis TaxID=342808 RepID=A0ABQ8UT09_9EUKA|nr:putative SET and MYND domain-containing protein [Paratrimastix pyriformis]